MRFAISPFALLCAFTVTLAWGATLTLPTFNSCAPASIGVSATGNYTIEGRDSTTNRLAFRAHVKKGVTRVTWDAVDLAANDVAVITVTEQTGPSPSQTSVVSASGVVMANPSGNTTCLAENDDAPRPKKAKSIVPTVVGVVLGSFVLLVLVLVGVALWRRHKEKEQRNENEDSVDLSHAYLAQNGAPVPAGGSYMARLVPGLNLHEAKPLPRDKRLEDEQAHYASTRRGTQYYNSPQVGGEFSMVGGGSGGGSGENKSQHKSGAYYQSYPSVWQRPDQQQYNDPFASQNDLTARPLRRGPYNQDPFVSQHDLHTKSPEQRGGYQSQDPFASQQDLHVKSPQQRGFQQDPFASQHDLHAKSTQSMQQQQQPQYQQQYHQHQQEQRRDGYSHDPFAFQHDLHAKSPHERGYSPSNFSD